MNDKMKGVITVIGVGPGNPDHLSRMAERALDAAEVIVGGARLVAEFGRANQEKIELEQNWSRLTDILDERRFRKNTAILVSGDPGLYGLLARLREHFGAHELEVIPGISSVQMMFARLTEPWQGIRVGSLHGRPLETILDLVAGGGRFCLFTDGCHQPSEIARFLLQQGFRGRAIVGERLSYPDERIEDWDLAELSQADPRSKMSVLYLDLEQDKKPLGEH